MEYYETLNLIYIYSVLAGFLWLEQDKGECHLMRIEVQVTHFFHSWHLRKEGALAGQQLEFRSLLGLSLITLLSSCLILILWRMVKNSSCPLDFLRHHLNKEWWIAFLLLGNGRSPGSLRCLHCNCDREACYHTLEMRSWSPGLTSFNTIPIRVVSPC